MNFAKKVMSLVYGMEFSHGIRRALMGALGIIYFLSFGFNLISITTLFAFSTIIMTFFEFPTGAIADYDSRKKSIMISFFLMSVAFFGLFIFRNFWLLAGSWVLGDIAWTFCSGASSAWSVDALKIGKNKKGLVSLIARGYFFEKGGRLMGGLIGLFVIAINFSFIWLVVSLINLVMFFIIWKYMEEKNFKPEKIPRNYFIKSLIKAKESFNFILHKKNRQLRVLMLGNFMGVIAASSFFVGMPLFFTKTLGLNPEQLSGIIALTAAITIISPLITEKIANKKGLKQSMVSFVFIFSIFIILFGLSQSIILAIISLAVINLAIAATDVTEDSTYQHEFDSKIRASLGSVGNIIWAVAFAISSFLTGLSITFLGIIPTIIISGCLALLEAFVYLIGLKK